MKFIVFISLLLVFILPSELKYNITIIATIIWFLSTIYYSIKLYKIKDKKITTDKYSMEPPNNNHSSYIRYLYKGKVDYKVFISTIIELLLKKSISLVRQNKDEYYFIDNNIEDEALTKSEAFLKNMLFKVIGEKECLSLNQMQKRCLKNSGYIYSVYREWKHIFVYECASNKYFKSNKNVIDASLIYFVSSLIIGIYNALFTKFVFIALLIFTIMAILTTYVNEMKKLEEDAKKEYICWLEFKNYIEKNDNSLDELDIISLENYATYAYVLDAYEPFINILNKKEDIEKSVFLQIIKLRIFDEVENKLKNSINTFNFNAKLLFAKNKGRR